MRKGIFGNLSGGIGGDANVIEAFFKEYLPECLNMNDVSFPRYSTCIV